MKFPDTPKQLLTVHQSCLLRNVPSRFSTKRLFKHRPQPLGDCAIEKAYEDSDKAGITFLALIVRITKPLNGRWLSGMKRNRKPQGSDAKECEKDWSEPQRIKSIQKGEWRATEGNRAVAGFHIPGLLSSFITPAQAAVEFTTVKDHPEQLRTWVNCYLGKRSKMPGM